MHGFDRLNQFLRLHSPPLIDEAEVNRLNMLLHAAEQQAECSGQWSVLSSYWLQYFGDAHMDKALHC